MAQVKPIVRAELDPLNPVQEICSVVMAILPYHPNQEAEILQGVKDAIEVRMKQLLRGAEPKDANTESLRKPDSE